MSYREGNERGGTHGRNRDRHETAPPPYHSPRKTRNRDIFLDYIFLDLTSHYMSSKGAKVASGVRGEGETSSRTFSPPAARSFHAAAVHLLHCHPPIYRLFTCENHLSFALYALGRPIYVILPHPSRFASSRFFFLFSQRLPRCQPPVPLPPTPPRVTNPPPFPF